VKLGEALDDLGRPVAYFPELARFFGSVTAAILFGQLWYWRDRAAHSFTFKKSAELESETGLSAREQRKARAVLVAGGILAVEHARLQHELHFTIDEAALDAQWQEWQRAGKPNRLRLTRRPVSPNLTRGERGRFERRDAVVPTAVRRSSGSTATRSSGAPSDGLRSHRLPQRVPPESTPDTPLLAPSPQRGRNAGSPPSAPPGLTASSEAREDVGAVELAREAAG
jgi:hypothetical protein